MPPITSSRPGARLTRSGLGGAKSAASSPRTRFSSVGTGSRSSSCIGKRAGGPRRRYALIARRAPALEDDLVEKTRLPGVERRGQNVIAVVADRRKLQVERVGAARAVPPRLLVGQRAQGAEPRVDE